MHREDIYKPLLGILLTGALAVIYYQIGDNETHDRISTGIAAFTFVYISLVVAWVTERWFWRAVGILVIAVGIALTYGLIFGRGEGWVNINQLTTRSILRASLDFGGVLTCLCLTAYVVSRIRGKDVRSLSLIDPGKDDQ